MNKDEQSALRYAVLQEAAEHFDKSHREMWTPEIAQEIRSLTRHSLVLGTPMASIVSPEFDGLMDSFGLWREQREMLLNYVHAWHAKQVASIQAAWDAEAELGQKYKAMAMEYAASIRSDEPSTILNLMAEFQKHPQLKSVIGREALILRCVSACDSRSTSMSEADKRAK